MTSRSADRDSRLSPTYFPAVPTIYISLLNHPKAKEYGVDRLRAFNSGAAPLPVEVIEQFERLTGVHSARVMPHGGLAGHSLDAFARTPQAGQHWSAAA